MSKMIEFGDYKGRPCLLLWGGYVVEDEDQPLSDIMLEIMKYRDALEGVKKEDVNG